MKQGVIFPAGSGFNSECLLSLTQRHGDRHLTEFGGIVRLGLLSLFAEKRSIAVMFLCVPRIEPSPTGQPACKPGLVDGELSRRIATISSAMPSYA
jgi:hypothetical protein